MVLNALRASMFGRPNWDQSDKAGRWDRIVESPSQVSLVPSHLSRNATERRRLQGLMRTPTPLSFRDSDRKAAGQLSLKQRFNIWMINEGNRKVFIAVWCFTHVLLFCFALVHYSLKDDLTKARSQLHGSYILSRSSAFLLHFEAAFILLPVCRNLISWLRRTPLGGVIPFDKNITFHKAVAWSMVFFTVLHIVGHLANFAELARESKTGFVGFLQGCFASGPGATGWFMTAFLGVIVYTSVEKRKRANFERFWYTHHLFILFFIFWQMHGMFCLIKPDEPPFCSWMNIGILWKYWLFGGSLYTFERILREVRARHRTVITKVIQHPSKVIEIQIKKDNTTTRAGQYIFLNCPEVSYWQWHPFTLTSTPEEDYISIHMRVAGDFTTALAKALGADPDVKSEKPVEFDAERHRSGIVIEPATNAVLPRVMIDGPFGSASEDYYKYEVVMLCSAGVGVTPFASILKSIWYRKHMAKQGKNSKPIRLLKVYFFWVCRDYNAFEWFASLLAAIEEQDLENFVEIHTYLTGRIKEDDINNIVVSDVGGERDAITRLRSPTHYGRPHWDRIFSSVKDKHPNTDVAVLFCGPKVLGSTLHGMCTKYTDGQVDGTHFVWGTENF